MKNEEKKSTSGKAENVSNPSKGALLTKPPHPDVLIQKASIFPKALTAADVLQLRSVLGNYSTTQLMRQIGKRHADFVQNTAQLKADVIQMMKNGDEPEPTTEQILLAIQFLEYIKDNKSLSGELAKLAVAQIKILEDSDAAEKYAELILLIKSKIPQEAILEPTIEKPIPVGLKSRHIHGIWVQGDYMKDKEFSEGMQTRQGSKAETWVNLIWVYQNLQESNATLFKEVDGMVCRSIKVGNMNMQEVDFKASMALWKGKPAWVEKFLPLLDIMLAKKSFVAMSDIMRMIILFYKGGLYQDVKIQMESPETKFFDEPLVNVEKLQLVDAGINKENWAMVAEAGCKMIETIMTSTLGRFPPAKELERLPENYAHDGKYSLAHKELHEDKGPWPEIQKAGSKVDSMSDVNPDLKLKNPRTVNSWTDTDDYAFNWRTTSPWWEMASGIQELPPNHKNYKPLDVLLALVRMSDFDSDVPNFWDAYDKFRNKYTSYKYSLSAVDAINYIEKQPPTRKPNITVKELEFFEEFKTKHPEFLYLD